MRMQIINFVCILEIYAKPRKSNKNKDEMHGKHLLLAVHLFLILLILIQDSKILLSFYFYNQTKQDMPAAQAAIINLNNTQ